MAWRLDSKNPSFAEDFRKLLNLKREVSQDVDDAVAEILERVKSEGDKALIDYTEQFDQTTLTASAMRISEEEVEAAVRACPKPQLSALNLAATRIRSFHEKQKPDNIRYTDDTGVTLGWRWHAIESVGLYVPGGLASYPSSVLMNALPARIAGVERLVMTVPAPGGAALNPLVLASARLAGIDEIYKIGGAQAIGALAYGTETIMAVDKIVGPGNAYVAAAKRRVFGLVGIDAIAGPSEILVLSDKSSDPRWVAADLLSQAEHDPSSQAILICDDRNFADKIDAEVTAQLAHSPRAAIAGAAWRDNSAIIIVRRLSDAAPLINQLAPEHLELCVDDPDSYLPLIRNAGAIFLGRHSPEAIGDYIAGPNHVLPTARTARFASGLSVLDFMKRSSVISCTQKSLDEIGPAATILAEAESLHSHAKSIEARCGRQPKRSNE